MKVSGASLPNDVVFFTSSVTLGSPPQIPLNQMVDQEIKMETTIPSQSHEKS
jgi:hypothetical protein